MVTNNTEVRLLAVPLENDYKHTLYFNDAAAQEAYFKSRTMHLAENVSYQRKDKYIAFPSDYDGITNCNYVMFRNTATSNKWYYGFITNMEYKNSSTTFVYFDIDVLQTYMFDYVVKPSFVEREHVTDDRIGLHILEEDLQLGEYVCQLHSKSGYGGNSFYIIVGISKAKNNVNSDMKMVVGDNYTGLFSGLAYRAFNYKTEREQMIQFLFMYDDAGNGEDVQEMFLAPAALIDRFAGPDNAGDGYGRWVANSETPDSYYINVNQGEYATITMSKGDLDGYTPRNKKLLTYPYRYLLVSNNNGVSVPYHFEDFHAQGSITPNQPTFKIEGCLCPGCSIRLIPLNYKGASRNDEEGMNLGKFPALNWTSDLYTNWLTQNAVNIGVDIASNVIMTAAGIGAFVAAPATLGATAAFGGMSAAQGIKGIANTMGEIYKASKSPAQSKGNTNAGDIISITGENDFHFYSMCIKKQYAQIIDGFFDMFGYKVNSIKTPNKNHRENYWYTKTIDASIDGLTIPAPEIEKIKACYNTGVTFWKNPDVIGDYTASNNII